MLSEIDVSAAVKTTAFATYRNENIPIDLEKKVLDVQVSRSNCRYEMNKLSSLRLCLSAHDFA